MDIGEYEVPTREKIGLIGTGIMGLPMGLNLLEAGYILSVYSRRKGAVQALCDKGCRFYDTAMALAENVDVVISCVSDTADVEDILLGDNGVSHANNPASLVIDMSTISAIKTREISTKLQESKIQMLDAPVSGGEVGAKAGTLTIMVGGRESDLQRALPILEVLGENITHIGKSGAGQIAKSCNQTIVAQTMVAVSEALHLAEAAGVSAGKVREALLGGFAYSKILDVHGQRMIDADYQPGFKTQLHHKDINIVRDVVSELGLNLTGTELSATYLDRLMALEYGESDSSIIHRVTCF